MFNRSFRPFRLSRTFSPLVLIAFGLSLAACGGSETTSSTSPSESGGNAAPAQQSAALDGDPAHGEEIFTTCAGCHGPDARGIQGLGKDLHSNEFIASMSDDEAVAFLKTGRPATHELNTTGVDMPPKGGNPAFTDQDLYDIIAYVRTLE